MPNPDFEPIIGSGFDDIGRQRLAWAGFNRGVEEDNLGRAAQAQRVRNEYLARIAQMQQSEAARQDVAQRQATELALGQQSDAEGRRRFEINLGLSKEDQAIKRADIAEKSQHWQWNLDRQNKQERQQLDEIEDYAKTKAPQIKKAKQDFETATEKWQKAQNQSNLAVAQIEKENPGAVFDPRTKRFKAADMKPESTQAQQKAEAEREKVIAALQDAQSEYALSSKDYDQLVKEAQGYGLTVLPDGSIHSPLHKKTWPKYTGGVSFETEFGSGITSGADAMRNPAPYSGFSSPMTGTGTTPAPGPAPIPAPSQAPASNVDSLRAEAMAAIRAGALMSEVMKRFKEKTGQDL